MVSSVGYRRAGRPPLLQPQTPIVVTRRVRRGQHELPVECYGVEGATEKKLAEHCHNAHREQEAADALRAKPDDHWTSIQYLCLTAILDRGADPDRWASARRTARAKLETEKGLDQAWAHGTLAELELLSVYNVPGSRTHDDILSAIQRHCDKLV
jgi:hypothetical protein